MTLMQYMKIATGAAEDAWSHTNTLPLCYTKTKEIRDRKRKARQDHSNADTPHKRPCVKVYPLNSYELKQEDGYDGNATSLINGRARGRTFLKYIYFFFN